ncbi:helix-turn-helix domain-containing protein [Streptomyces sp. B93]|uniref:winged helix-turn-helix transcriptional regulator n=1 Tax=Streptomyces sp. B93 TaxID=2824875 RepID=UPI0027E5BA2C|nr:helix-turn-helix domain-containing protein [Streptomyces sp. B93]
MIDRIGDKWSVTVICRLDDGPLRFNALRRVADGITQRMLSTTVRRLERDGLISRTVEYALTERGRNLHGVVRRDREGYDAAVGPGAEQ